MAPSPSLLSILFFFFVLVSFFSPLSHAAKLPFHPEDLLPLLPRQVSWPILNSLHSPVDLLPSFVGAASSQNDTVEWKGACFYNNTAWMEFHNKSGSEFGGGTLHIEVSNAHSWTCMDLYVFATPYRVTWDYYFLSREHTFEFKEWEGRAEFEYVKNKGVSIFLMQAGMLGTLQALWDVFPYLQILDGSLEKWVSGAYAGHTAVCLKDSEGKLWVGESGHENEEGEDIIAVLPWDEWWDFELNKDDSNPHIALLPLHPDIRAKFNETAAWEYVQSMDGKPYGYHNMIFSWIDTIDGNYPPPLDSHLVASVMTVWNQLKPDYAANLWNEALNKRLGTEDLGLPDILVEIEERGSSFDELLTIPEQDDWLYTDGKSTSCVAFILEMYKEAGLFDPIASSIQVTEFTIKDAYMLNFFENNSSQLPKWCNDGDTVELPFCQIRGMYRMELPGYNSMEPYSHMNERCPSLPPKYLRPQKC
ncbi:hypothetical protein CJ030_MR4G025816 [Morella rubra]|uniref:Inositol-1,4,5-trisphosphate 5-phosphatase 4 n=1 Tax=Morella rubra TaxID=262757 RepID=A0A6A1VT54_9ROSI|nr:hypothetical protein CJ030_MR4G025816 [Morella rubra]